jgi:hypothetical protein
MGAPLKGDPSIAYGKLSTAIDVLTVGPGDIRERLQEAFVDFHSIAAEDFPESLREDYNWIVVHLTRFGPRLGQRSESWPAAIENTMGRIKRQTGVKIAKRLVKLREDLAAHLGRRNEL